MGIEVTVKKRDPVTVASLSMKGPFSLMGEAFGRLFGWIGEKGYVPAGPPAGVFYSNPHQVAAEELMWEIYCPIGSDVSPSGPDEQGLSVKTIEGADVAATMHKGPYEQVAPTYGALAEWIMGNGYDIAGPPEEVYLSDPGSTPPVELLTEVRFPVTRE